MSVQAGGSASVPSSPARDAAAAAGLEVALPRALLRFFVAVARGAARGWGAAAAPTSAPEKVTGSDIVSHLSTLLTHQGRCTCVPVYCDGIQILLTAIFLHGRVISGRDVLCHILSSMWAVEHVCG